MATTMSPTEALGRLVTVASTAALREALVVLTGCVARDERSQLDPAIRARLERASAGGWTSDGHTLVGVGDLRAVLRVLDGGN
jgi:hypothetical protein